jgi:hypothetical protein
MEGLFPGLIPSDAQLVSHIEVLKVRMSSPDRPLLGSIVSWQGRFYRVDRVDLESGEGERVLTLTRTIEAPAPP